MPKIFRKAVLAILMASLWTAPALADVLDFEDLGPGSQYILSSVGAFQFGTNNLYDTAWFYSDNAGGNYQPHSGSTFLATDASLYTGSAYEPAQAISSDSPFIFNGAYFSGTSSIGYELYLNSHLVFSTYSSSPLSGSPMFIASGYKGATDSVVILGQQGRYALDDFTYQSAITAVPEPTSWLLVMVGFGVMGGAVRRRRCAQPIVRMRLINL